MEQYTMKPHARLSFNGFSRKRRFVNFSNALSHITTITRFRMKSAELNLFHSPKPINFQSKKPTEFFGLPEKREESEDNKFWNKEKKSAADTR